MPRGGVADVTVTDNEVVIVLADKGRAFPMSLLR